MKTVKRQGAAAQLRRKKGKGASELLHFSLPPNIFLILLGPENTSVRFSLHFLTKPPALGSDYFSISSTLRLGSTASTELSTKNGFTRKNAPIESSLVGSAPRTLAAARRANIAF